MNYKILAASGIGTVFLIGVTIAMTNGDGDRKQVVERVTSVDVDERSAPENEFGFYEASSPSILPSLSAPVAPPPPPAPSAERASNVSIPADEALTSSGPSLETGPKIAYRYGYGFQLAADAIQPLQNRHADLCEQRGPDVCRIISMEQSASDASNPSGRLHLAVATPLARTFGKELTRSAEGANGELVSSSIDGEDLSKRIVDTEARLRTRIVLRDRLLDVLRNRRGTVAELVEAERGVAQVNEEIDQAQSWLSEMRGRVDFAQIHIDYTTGAPFVESSANPVTAAVSSAGGTLAVMLGALIRLLTIFVPIGLLVWVVVLVWRRLGRPGFGPWTTDERETAEA